MRTVVELDNETAAKLLRLADVKNISFEELITTCLRGLAEEGRIVTKPYEDRAAAFEEWIADFTADRRPLSDEAISRASIYENN